MCEFFLEMVRPEGLEPSTPGLEGPSSGYSKAVIKGSHLIATSAECPPDFVNFIELRTKPNNRSWRRS